MAARLAAALALCLSLCVLGENTTALHANAGLLGIPSPAPADPAPVLEQTLAAPLAAARAAFGAAFGSPRPLPSQAPVPRLSSLPLPTAAPPLLRTVAYAARDGAVLGALAGTTQLACGTTQNSVLQLQGTAAAYALKLQAALGLDYLQVASAATSSGAVAGSRNTVVSVSALALPPAQAGACFGVALVQEPDVFCQALWASSAAPTGVVTPACYADSQAASVLVDAALATLNPAAFTGAYAVPSAAPSAVGAAPAAGAQGAPAPAVAPAPSAAATVGRPADLHVPVSDVLAAVLVDSSGSLGARPVRGGGGGGAGPPGGGGAGPPGGGRSAWSSPPSSPSRGTTATTSLASSLGASLLRLLQRALQGPGAPSPGGGTVTATFTLTAAQLAAARALRDYGIYAPEGASWTLGDILVARTRAATGGSGSGSGSSSAGAGSGTASGSGRLLRQDSAAVAAERALQGPPGGALPGGAPPDGAPPDGAPPGGAPPGGAPPGGAPPGGAPTDGAPPGGTPPSSVPSVRAAPPSPPPPSDVSAPSSGALPSRPPPSVASPSSGSARSPPPSGTGAGAASTGRPSGGGGPGAPPSVTLACASFSLTRGRYDPSLCTTVVSGAAPATFTCTCPDIAPFAVVATTRLLVSTPAFNAALASLTAAGATGSVNSGALESLASSAAGLSSTAAPSAASASVTLSNGAVGGIVVGSFLVGIGAVYFNLHFKAKGPTPVSIGSSEERHPVAPMHGPLDTMPASGRNSNPLHASASSPSDPRGAVSWGER